MRLYLSSFRIGNRPDVLRSLLRGRSRTLLINNAADARPPDERKTSVEEELARLREAGLDPVELDLRDWFGDRGGLRDHLASFGLLWVRGGNTFVLRRALRDSGADGAIRSLLDDDALVYGGYSAGVCVLAPSLRGIDIADDPRAAADGDPNGVIWEGLGVLPYAVAPHYRSDHPESELIEAAVRYFIDHHVPFVALRDGEAIVVEGARSEVVG